MAEEPEVKVGVSASWNRVMQLTLISFALLCVQDSGGGSLQEISSKAISEKTILLDAYLQTGNSLIYLKRETLAY